MFRLLVLSDLVIADVSIHNANVFYELGIRHGLRDRHTLLMRAKGTQDEYPFDLRTDRYGQYDPADPPLRSLAFSSRSSRRSVTPTRTARSFELLPRLTPHDRSALMVVVRDFQEEVGIAQKARRASDLRLLAQEVPASSGVARDCGLLATRNFRSRRLPEPRRPSNCFGAWTTTIFLRPTIAWARSIRSWQQRPWPRCKA